MIILGLSAYSHEASACLVIDGKPVLLVEEERINREKHTWRFPEGAIREVLSMASIKPGQIDQVTFFWKPWKEITQNVRHFLSFFPESLNLLFSGSGSDELSFLKRFVLLNLVKRKLLSLYPDMRPDIPVYYVDHHLSHAASCFFTSPFENAAIMTLDGRGEANTAFFGVGNGLSIKCLDEWKVPYSLGHFYSAITDFLGFNPFYDEYKVMGLSAYGSDRFCDDFRKIIRYLPSGKIHMDLKYFSFHTHGRDAWLSSEFYRKFGKPRDKNEDDEKIQEVYCDIAYAAQKMIEETAVSAARSLREKTHMKNLVMAGGVFQNTKMNSKIAEESGFSDFFFHPVANDAGTSMGSALYFAHVVKKKPRSFVWKDVYSGPCYSDAEMEEVIKLHLLQYNGVFRITKPENIAKECASRIADGKIAGWFQGKMECGPRALGNRSIVADPGNRHIRDILNKKIKKREMFRPFAASVLKEFVEEYFDLPYDSPFMQLIGKVKKDKKELLPAVVHEDGTTRIQTVSEDGNHLFRKLIYEFYCLTNLPLVLNTSFNENEPIVMTPDHAVRCFLKTGMDVLCLGPFLIERQHGDNTHRNSTVQLAEEIQLLPKTGDDM